MELGKSSMSFRYVSIVMAILLLISGTALAKSQLEFDEQNVVLRFGAMSDLHFTGGAEKFTEAVKQLYKRVGDNKLDAIVVAGDLTDSGSPAEIAALKAALDKLEVNKKGTKFIFALGNHDTNFDALPYNGLAFSKGLKEYAFEGATEDEIKNGNHCLRINGYYFLAVNTKKYNGGCEHAKEDLDWLQTKLKEAVNQAPDKPVFVIFHPLVYDTVYGSNSGSYWASKNINELLKDYPQVITFGGHLHSPLNDERTIFQRDFTSLNTASIKYVALDDVVSGVCPIELEGGSAPKNCNYFSQGLYLEVDKNNNVRVTRLDFFREAEIKYPWIIPTPKIDKSHLKFYTLEARTVNNKAPYFATDAYVNIRRVAKKKLDIEFSTAIDDDLVYAYEVYLLDKESGSLVGSTYAVTFSDFYMTPDPKKMQEKVFRAFSTDHFKIATGEFDPTKEYVIKIIALDSYGLKSQPIYSEPEGTSN